jgi:plasmid stability protein
MAKPASPPRPGAPGPRPPASAKKATFNLDPRLHQRLKVAAALHRRQMTDLVEDALRLHLDALEKRKKIA